MRSTQHYLRNGISKHKHIRIKFKEHDEVAY